jgi:starch synthase (maltosyl-transferring)
MKPAEGRKRVIIEEVRPEVDCGHYPAKRTIGDTVTVTAAVFGDGHDHVAGRLLYRHESETEWHSTPLTALTNDLWTTSFPVDKLGYWRYTLEAWVDHFETWCADLHKRIDAQPQNGGSPSMEIPLALRTGIKLLEETLPRAREQNTKDANLIQQVAISLRWLADQNAAHYDYPFSDEFIDVVARYPDLTLATRYPQELRLWVDRERASYSAWYELFPRSASTDLSHHGTFADVEALIPSIAAMGFDVLYMPPIHPIGRSFRKGRNNTVTSGPDDPGSPWAIGAAEGGHKAIHPQLGTFNDFEHLRNAAQNHGMELALDIAFQCSPDHPWVTEHPEWFVIRPDGSIQYAENPPKKYQDIYPINFESSGWEALWQALYDVFVFWIKLNVRIFRVDNPHTKAFSFWQWCIDEIRRDYPDVIFLAEAFTRPHVMYSLAKAGFTQSYTYFTWRNDRDELEQYFEEITRPPISDFFRPNLWPNTPDILHATLQEGGRPAFMQRFVLAATLGANYGIYGPAFELCENIPIKPGSEEYFHSEKYEQRLWDRSSTHSLAPLITRVNNIRRENIALHSNRSLFFHHTDNPHLICYSKQTPDNLILVAVNLDPHEEQSGWIDLDLKQLGIPHDTPFDIEDLLTGAHYTWRDRSNYVALRPEVMPAHIFRVTRPPQAEPTPAAPTSEPEHYE